jgi:glycerol-3-phosphate dehydrogenase
VLDPVDVALPASNGLDEAQRRRLLGRYGADAPHLVAAARPGELAPVAGTDTLWAELRWAARDEGVVHLDDLLLRRVRLGHLLPEGARAQLPRIRDIVQPELKWDDARWVEEERAYLDLWHDAYNLPDRARVPDWRAMLEQARQARAERQAAQTPRRRKVAGGSLLGVVLLLLAALALWWRWRRSR